MVLLATAASRKHTGDLMYTLISFGVLVERLHEVWLPIGMLIITYIQYVWKTHGDKCFYFIILVNVLLLIAWIPGSCLFIHAPALKLKYQYN